MANSISFASWNVEHFHGKKQRIARVVDFIKTKGPDIFGLYEVKGKTVFSQLTETMPNYNFFITERDDESSMEIMVGWKKQHSVFVTQRDEFRSKVPTLRPGTMATLIKDGKRYVFLFLHLKSFDDPRSFGLRDDMFLHCASLRRALNNAGPANNKARLIILGDLNTMGLDVKYSSKSDLNQDDEISILDRRMSRAGMRRAQKTHELSWWNGSPNYAPGSKLDHVIIDKDLELQSIGDDEIEVLGWPQEDTVTKQKQGINKFSDHAMLFGRIKI